MGLVILPILIAALIIFIKSLMRVIKLIKNKEVVLSQFVWGFLYAILFYGLIVLYYKSQKSVVDGDEFGTIPMFLFFLPYLNLKLSEKYKIMFFDKYISIPILISILFSGVFSIIFFNYYFGIVQKLGLEVHH